MRQIPSFSVLHLCVFLVIAGCQTPTNTQVAPSALSSSSSPTPRPQIAASVKPVLSPAPSLAPPVASTLPSPTTVVLSPKAVLPASSTLLLPLQRARALRLSLPAFEKVGQQHKARVEVLDAQNQVISEPFALRWESLTPARVSVSEQGDVKVLAAGASKIKVYLTQTNLTAEMDISLFQSTSGGGGGGGGGGESHHHNVTQQPTIAPAHHAPAHSPVSAQTLWSDPATWQALGREKPLAGEQVTIPAGQHIVLDESPPPLAGLHINGTLEVAQSAHVQLNAHYIMLHGTLQAGTSQQPFDGHFTVTLSDTNPEASAHGAMGTRGILSMGGHLALFGQAPATPWTRLNQHLPAGAQQLSVLIAEGWEVGDELVIAPTDFHGVSQTERASITQINGNQVRLQQGLQTARWGVLQYLTPHGMGLTPGYVSPTGSATVLDERAAVGNLSRNIVIQGADDTLWQNQGFGGQIMIMGNDSHTQINGVELRRMGQAGRMGRYPIHFHILSYDPSGAERPSGGVREIRNNAIWDSRNRCVTIHGTNDVILDGNICHNIDGHAIFLEDAVERRNQITRNLVLGVHVPAQPLIDSDRPNFTRGPSGFWLTNPDNTVTGNLAADTAGNGFWMAFPESPLGFHSHVQMSPDHLPFGAFDDNTSHSNGEVGIQLDWVPFNEQGETRPHSYAPTTDGQDHGYDYNFWSRFTLRHNTTFKNRGAGLWNRTTWPTYEGWVSADNLGVFFSGAGAEGYIQHALVVGESLNNQNTWRTVSPLNGSNTHQFSPVAFASYHSTYSMQNNSVVNFPFVDAAPSGAFKTNDYYITGVDRGLVRNQNNHLINSHPGFRSTVPAGENWALAGALWDPHGYWGNAGNYWVYDTPFLTANVNCQPVEPAGQNGQSCASEYYGVGGFVVDQSTRYTPFMPIEVTRLDATGNTLGTWQIARGIPGQALNHMRHFAALPEGRYTLDFPGDPVPTERVEMDISNAYRPEDTFLLGVRFSGQQTAAVRIQSPHHTRILQSVADLATVETGAGDVFWHDTNNDMLWLRVRTPGDYPAFAPSNNITDGELYQSFRLIIESA